MHFELATEAAVLSTRARSADLTAKIEQRFDGSATELVLDFKGVRFVSWSFAYEFLSAMIGQARCKGLQGPKLINLEPEIEGALLRSLSARQRAAVEIVAGPLA